MGPRQEFSKTSRPDEFKLGPLTPQQEHGGFQCAIAEYNDYLANDALRSLHDHIALTWRLIVVFLKSTRASEPL